MLVANYEPESLPSRGRGRWLETRASPTLTKRQPCFACDSGDPSVSLSPS
jgi:hypothetical protein